MRVREYNQWNCACVLAVRVCVNIINGIVNMWGKDKNGILINNNNNNYNNNNYNSLKD